MRNEPTHRIRSTFRTRGVAYDGALAYLTGRMPGAPIPHTEIAAKGHAIAETLFAIESARALFYRAISEARVEWAKQTRLAVSTTRYCHIRSIFLQASEPVSGYAFAI